MWTGQILHACFNELLDQVRSCFVGVAPSASPSDPCCTLWCCSCPKLSYTCRPQQLFSFHPRPLTFSHRIALDSLPLNFGQITVNVMYNSEPWVYTMATCRIAPRAEGARSSAMPHQTSSQSADADRNAELSNANKSFADRRVTGDPPCSSPRGSPRGSSPRGLKYSSPPTIINHILLNTGPVSAFWASSAMSSSQ
jgi:hypothetical protein